MDMSFDTKALGPLFALSHSAVIGVEDGIVRFSNPAAHRLTGLQEGDDASAVFSAEILANPAEAFSAACALNGVPTDISVVRIDGFTLISAAARETPPTLPSMARALAEFGADLASSTMAVGALLSGGTEKKKQDNASVLYRSLYRLRRLHNHMTLADCIMQNSLPCRRRLTDLRPVCEDICDSVGQTVRSLGYTIRFTAPETTCFSMIDTALIETMLLNILTNSLMYTESGSEIAVTLSTIGDRCVIAVSDPGRGMDALKLSGALSGDAPAALTDTNAGPGLGLFVARGIAEAHGGTIILESREGVGTSVRISLPHIRSDGLSVLSHPDEFRHISGMDPILTELSVFLNRRYYTENLFD